MSAASDQDPPQFVIVMGVSGSGKTTIATALAHRLGWDFAEGDDFHPAANVEKMAHGVPLTDKDRWPWLRAIGAWMDQHAREGRSAVITCSALKRAYRDLLVEGRERVRFCDIDVPAQELQRRLAARTGHYMPASLLPSQLAALQPLDPDEPGVVVHAHGDPQEVVAEAFEKLGFLDQPGRA